MKSKFLKISAAVGLQSISAAALAANSCCGALSACCLEMLACCFSGAAELSLIGSGQAL